MLVAGYPLFYYFREHERRIFMAKVRERNQLLQEQSRDLEQKFTAIIRDFEGNSIQLDNEAYEYKVIFHGDFQNFFKLYAEIQEDLKDFKILSVFLTDSPKVKEVMQNVMKVKLENTLYAFEEDVNMIAESGIKRNTFYFLNQSNEVISSSEITPKDDFSINKAIQNAKTQIKKDIDRKFLKSFEFRLESQKSA